MLMCFQFYGVFWGVSLAKENKDGGCVAFVGTGERGRHGRAAGQEGLRPCICLSLIHI